jgi:NADPH:quinone reductase-like Zn-dependent oxidoreductase
VLTLTGEYGQLPPLPAVGGREGVGRVAELGEDTRGVTVGQLVLLPLGCGTWATHVVTEAAQLTPLPDEADPLQLSMMTINPPTAVLLLSEFVRLGPGDWVIQKAANSAVGLYLVQLARHRGHRSVNVVRRQDAATAVREAGAARPSTPPMTSPRSTSSRSCVRRPIGQDPHRPARLISQPRPCRRNDPQPAKNGTPPLWLRRWPLPSGRG